MEALYGEKTLAYRDCVLERTAIARPGAPDFRRDHRREPRHKDADRFAEVEKIEAMSPEEKFAFFQNELSRCIALQRLPQCVSGVQLPQMCLRQHEVRQRTEGERGLL